MDKHAAFTRILDDTLRQKLERFEKEMAKCKKKLSEKATHGVRISLRRLIAAMDVTTAIVDMVKTAKYRKALKKSLDSFGALRDVQVRLAEAGRLKAQFPEMEPYAAELKTKEKRLTASITKEMGKIKLPKIKKGIQPAIKRMRKAPRAELRQEMYFADAFNFVDKRHNDVVQKSLRIKASDIKSIHDMRVAFKKFRYSVEALKPALGGVTAEKLKEMHDFQQLMGDINDVHALMKDISRFAKSKEGKAHSFDKILAELKARYASLVTEFTKNLKKVQGFWSGFGPEED